MSFEMPRKTKIIHFFELKMGTLMILINILKHTNNKSCKKNICEFEKIKLLNDLCFCNFLMIVDWFQLNLLDT